MIFGVYICLRMVRFAGFFFAGSRRILRGGRNKQGKAEYRVEMGENMKGKLWGAAVLAAGLLLGTGAWLMQPAGLQTQAAEASTPQAAVIDDDAVLIEGPAEVSQEQMVRYIRQRNPEPKLQCTVEQLVAYYYEEGEAEGIRPDVALCQAIKESACFAYGGVVSPSQNNYCGLGATSGSEPGAWFAAPQRGARAHIQHLMAYATVRQPKQKIIDPRYELLRQKYPQFYGQIHTWTGLNGKWAVPGTHYGQEILAIWREVKKI